MCVSVVALYGRDSHARASLAARIPIDEKTFDVLDKPNDESNIREDASLFFSLLLLV